MAGHRPFNELRAGLSANARAAADARGAALRGEVLLTRLRVAPADASPDADPPTDTETMPVAALRQMVRSYGGELDVAVTLPDGRRVSLGESVGIR